MRKLCDNFLQFATQKASKIYAIIKTKYFTFLLGFISIPELQNQLNPWMVWWSILDDLGPYFFLEKVISEAEREPLI